MQAADGGSAAECLGYDIITQADTWEEPGEQVTEAAGGFLFQPRQAGARAPARVAEFSNIPSFRRKPESSSIESRVNMDSGSPLRSVRDGDLAEAC